MTFLTAAGRGAHYQRIHRALDLAQRYWDDTNRKASQWERAVGLYSGNIYIIQEEP